MSKNFKMCVVRALHNLDFTPDGRKMKKISKKKRVETGFRCSAYERKLLKLRAKKAGISLSEFCYRAAFNVTIVERLNQDEIEAYKMLVQYSHNFTRIGNMYRKRNPKLTEEVYALAKEIKSHLENFKKW